MTSPEADNRYRHPTTGRWGQALAAAMNHGGWARARRAVMARLPFMTLASDVHDVVYLNWLVPVAAAQSLAPPGLTLWQQGGWTPFTVLSYRHRHFGPAALGPLRRLCPSPRQSNWRLYLADLESDSARPHSAEPHLALDPMVAAPVGADVTTTDPAGPHRTEARRAGSPLAKPGRADADAAGRDPAGLAAAGPGGAEPTAPVTHTVLFLKNVMDSLPFTLATRLFSDALPTHLPQSFTHQRVGHRIATTIAPGRGSAPALNAAVELTATRQFAPEAALFAQVFGSWDQAVRMLACQDAAITAVPTAGTTPAPLAWAAIDLPIALPQVVPALPVAPVQCALLAAFAQAVGPFCFVVEQVPFRVLSERVLPR
ncbi:hypothetical protein CCO03_14665 [Comamonas serinivorans]|uniref:Uncharacterized protein n=1 Tax=Comamonas serinivorans TaxID=1082851 RepID=A0A1Y0EQT3_9BURK|nr:hypothetical protein [Comamonas serinivorans]ARU05761.1 hypothetical protein CCO03_14665 [Comamonas serinivorans]